MDYSLLLCIEKQVSANADNESKGSSRHFLLSTKTTKKEGQVNNSDGTKTTNTSKLLSDHLSASGMRRENTSSGSVTKHSESSFGMINSFNNASRH